MTEEEFQGLVHLHQKKGLRFIPAVYAALEQAIAEDETKPHDRFACKAGCTMCCHQAVTCTQAEFQEIVNYIDGLPKKDRSRLLNIAYQKSKEVYDLLQSDDSVGQIAASQEAVSHLNKITDNKPCPFLQADSKCGIYDVRPIDCRTFHSTTTCQKLRWPDAVRLVPQCESWANQIILEYAQATSGMFVQLVHTWLLSWRLQVKNQKSKR